MWHESLPPVIGALVGAAGAILATVVTLRWNYRKEQSSMAGAFAGEISALCEIARSRKYLENAKNLEQWIVDNNEPKLLILQARQNFFVVYEKNANSIGILSYRTSNLIARFYTIAKSLIEDFAPDSIHQQVDQTPENCLRTIREQIQAIQTLFEIEKELIPLLSSMAR